MAWWPSPGLVVEVLRTGKRGTFIEICPLNATGVLMARVQWDDETYAGTGYSLCQLRALKPMHRPNVWERLGGV